MRLLDPFNVLVGAIVKGCSRQDQNRRIDTKRKHQGDRAVPCCHGQSITFCGVIFAVGTRLNDARMQIKIMWHHSCPNDPERQIQHLLVHHNFTGGGETRDHFAPNWVGQSN